MSIAATSSSLRTATRPLTGTPSKAFASSMTGTGHICPRTSTTIAPWAELRGAPGVRWARTSATAGGRTERNSSTCAAVASRPSETRMLPSVNAPIAARTWLGVRVLEVQEEPEETAKPARSRAPSRDSPST